MKILLAYDPERDGDTGINLAIEQAKAFKGEVHVIVSLMVGDKGHAFDTDKENKAKKKLEMAENKFKQAGVPCTTEILIRGLSPGEDIVKHAEQNRIDLIIVGAKNRSRVSKLLLGSTTQYVILKSTCPVLAFKE